MRLPGFTALSGGGQPWVGRGIVTALAVFVGTLVTGCGAHAAATRDAEVQASQARRVAAPAAGVTKLLVVVEENHSLAQMKTGMPYTFGLARMYGYASNYFAIGHPSLPNYLAIAGGSTDGIHDDASPAVHRLTGASVFGQALAHHRTAAVYAQSMPRPCATSDSGAYAVRHNPWTYYVRERAQCRAHDVPMARFGRDVAAGALPNVGMVIPDLLHDAHDGTLGQADAWFRALMSRVFAGPDWHSGHLAVVLTADEDDHAQGNRVLTVIIHPSQRHHVVTRRLDHYSLNRLYDLVAHVPVLDRARTAASTAGAFGLPVP